MKYYYLCLLLFCIGCSGLKVNTEDYSVTYWSFLNNRQFDKIEIQKDGVSVRVERIKSEVDGEVVRSAVEGAVKGFKVGL